MTNNIHVINKVNAELTRIPVKNQNVESLVATRRMLVPIAACFNMEAALAKRIRLTMQATSQPHRTNHSMLKMSTGTTAIGEKICPTSVNSPNTKPMMLSTRPVIAAM